MPIASALSESWLHYAREVVGRAAHGRDARDVPIPPAAVAHSGVFVTLYKVGRLRGCMGTLDSSLSLAEAIREAAKCAATRDPRFAPVSPDELPELHVEVSVMSAAWPMTSLNDLEIGRHGIIVRSGPRRGLFLPQVAKEHRLDRETFLTRCCTEKAGLPADAWRDPATEVLLFETTVLSESGGR